LPSEEDSDSEDESRQARQRTQGHASNKKAQTQKAKNTPSKGKAVKVVDALEGDSDEDMESPDLPGEGGVSLPGNGGGGAGTASDPFELD
jgi:hypothetical protein